MNDVLAKIQSISDEAYRALSDPELPRSELVSALSVRRVIRARPFADPAVGSHCRKPRASRHPRRLARGARGHQGKNRRRRVWAEHEADRRGRRRMFGYAGP